MDKPHEREADLHSNREFELKISEGILSHFFSLRYRPLGLYLPASDPSFSFISSIRKA